MNLDNQGGGLRPDTPRVLGLIAAAMGGGVAALLGVVAAFHWQCRKSPTLQEIAMINRMTGAAMAAALVAIAASELVWKNQLRRIDGENADGVLRTAFIVRTALREMSAILGAVVALMAAMNGVLKIFPAYWGTLVPSWLFFGYLAMHWPSRENLESELSGVVRK